MHEIVIGEDCRPNYKNRQAEKENLIFGEDEFKDVDIGNQIRYNTVVPRDVGTHGALITINEQFSKEQDSSIHHDLKHQHYNGKLRLHHPRTSDPKQKVGNQNHPKIKRKSSTFAKWFLCCGGTPSSDVSTNNVIAGLS